MAGIPASNEKMSEKTPSTRLAIARPESGWRAQELDPQGRIVVERERWWHCDRLATVETPGLAPGVLITREETVDRTGKRQGSTRNTLEMTLDQGLEEDTGVRFAWLLAASEPSDSSGPIRLL